MTYIKPSSQVLGICDDGFVILAGKDRILIGASNEFTGQEKREHNLKHNMSNRSHKIILKVSEGEILDEHEVTTIARRIAEWIRTDLLRSYKADNPSQSTLESLNSKEKI